MAEDHRINTKPAPTQLGPYRLMQEVGAGGVGRVFKAIDERSGRTVAVKILHDALLSDRKRLGHFHRELLIMSSFSHRHIVSYLDSYFNPPDCYIVTEFIEGWSGYALYKKTGRMPPLVALCILIDVLKGVDYLHLHNTIHSDLSAANYLVDKNGRVALTDFGLSIKVEVEDYKNYSLGTPGYYAPEHITGSGITPATDLYCAGLILYELIVGQKAVPATKDTAKNFASMKKIHFELIQTSDPKVTKKIRALLEKALAFNPSRRFGAADEMMWAAYEIVKRYNIRFARYAVNQYLIDKGLAEGTTLGPKQDIYRGF
jgi:eukaryotic-like serine/threonine-protein kinase